MHHRNYHFFSAPPVRWLVALVWTLWISIILIQPEAQPVIDIGLRPAPPSFERELVFTAGHVIAFGVTALLWWWVMTRYTANPRALIVSVCITLIIGIVTESLQAYAPDRHPSIADLLANVAGASLVALWLYRHGQTLHTHTTQPAG